MRRYFAEGEYDATQGALVYGVDHLGSVRDVIAGASGQKLNHFDYDPYGNATIATGSHANWTDYRYGGLFYNQTSGLYLATYRAYDPAVGRWLSRDPIEEQGGLNLYAYVDGNPINGIDPLGLDESPAGEGTPGDPRAPGPPSPAPYEPGGSNPCPDGSQPPTGQPPLPGVVEGPGATPPDGPPDQPQDAFAGTLLSQNPRSDGMTQCNYGALGLFRWFTTVPLGQPCPKTSPVPFS
jgi:RHS repeat-associated protein